ncbi:CRISPR-associated endonuclease Cas1 [Synechocystis sp. PCC 6714]|uniref:CRISPR-associated endonuclease Cas1 n=1 Tax=Synechocystis sp. (strain PCC 6714) TaxID=1147 RepID=UPI00048C293C|nr:CRISPR-associated endonuclease Cas1 [Synechocystis sp. PCC 6714]
MKTLYVSQSDCYVSLRKEFLLVKRQDRILAEVQLLFLEQVLIFGKAQVTTQAIHACLSRNIPILYLSRMGFCYGRIIAIERGYRHLSRYQQELGWQQRLITARTIVTAKIKNARVFLQRQHRKHPTPSLQLAIDGLKHFVELTIKAERLEQLLGYEGTAANLYFQTWADCIKNSNFIFFGRSRRPPGNPVNAMLSFGYQVLWNHLLTLIELQGLDPYQACLHQGSERHAALASDLIEEFRVPIVDSLVLYMINRRLIDVGEDFVFQNGGCFLNSSGRRKWLGAFVGRMEKVLSFDQGDFPRWHCLIDQVKKYKAFIYSPSNSYSPFLIR